MVVAISTTENSARNNDDTDALFCMVREDCRTEGGDRDYYVGVGEVKPVTLLEIATMSSVSYNFSLK